MKYYAFKPGVLRYFGLPPKILLIMKLVIVMLFTVLMQVSASSLAQRITLSERNASLKQVLNKIKVQSGFQLVYLDKQLEGTKKISLHFKDLPLESALEQVFNDQNLNFSIKDKTIVIRDKEPSLVDRLTAVITNLLKNIDVRGNILNADGVGLPGATVKVKSTGRTVSTDANGNFYLKGVEEGAVLVVSFIGYLPKEVKAAVNIGNIVLELSDSKLEEVEIVNTGYQNIPKERATGSFVQINNELLNRAVSTNVLDRLKGVASGLIFTDNNNHQFGQSNIEIRGRATLFSNPDPLIIVDNFPYDGEISNINPNDIESITVLKDAAAASAWGSRSGNGVIVITTKKGSLNGSVKVDFNASVNIGQKPDLNYSKQLTSAEYIDVEQFLFNKGAFDNNIDNGYSVLSPAVEVFLAKRNGLISKQDSVTDIGKLKNYDIRQQLLKYYYKPIVNQQYQASVSGGNSSQKYFVSAGYDKNLNGTVNNSYSRTTLNASNTYFFLKNKLEFNSSLLYTSSKSIVGQDIRSGVSVYPYQQLADSNGNPINVFNSFYGLRSSYLKENEKLIDWTYKPLEELNNNYSSTIYNVTNYRLNFMLNYNILKGLNASLLYSYENGVNESNRVDELESYYTRNLINTFTQIDPSGTVTYPLPKGAIKSTYNTRLKSNNGRFQINFENSWEKSSVNAIAGVEIRDYTSFSTSNILYGYNSEVATNQNNSIDFTKDYPYSYGFNAGRIASGEFELGNTNRFFSYYFNGSYTYSNKYILSLSARRDESNLFGVATNQKGIPLWSSGLMWVLNREEFYNSEWLTNLKLRVTYGYTGNVNNSISAYLTAVRGNSAQRYNVPYNEIINPPNPSLRWEKIGTLNVGLDFGIKNNRLNGAIDIWTKKGIDLIGNSPIGPQTGITLYTGNSANTLTKGLDIQLNSNNLIGSFKWNTTLLFNYSRSKVTDYKVSNGSNYNVVSSNYNNPLQGYPYYSIFSFKYAGLDLNGNPQGYLNNKMSSDYASINNSTNRDELVYNGSATPTFFGYLRNDFLYRNFNLSFNIGYKLGYYFRRTSLNNSQLYGGSYQFPDYSNRWQKAGDELKTNVPSLVYPGISMRDNLYTYSDILVEKGDHIRLQDIRVGYDFRKKKYSPFNNLNVFCYINNLGVLWRANKYGIDPDYPTGIPTVRTFALGLKGDF